MVMTNPSVDNESSILQRSILWSSVFSVASKFCCTCRHLDTSVQVFKYLVTQSAHRGRLKLLNNGHKSSTVLGHRRAKDPFGVVSTVAQDSKDPHLGAHPSSNQPKRSET